MPCRAVTKGQTRRHRTVLPSRSAPPISTHFLSGEEIKNQSKLTQPSSREHHPSPPSGLHFRLPCTRLPSFFLHPSPPSGLHFRLPCTRSPSFFFLLIALLFFQFFILIPPSVHLQTRECLIWRTKPAKTVNPPSQGAWRNGARGETFGEGGGGGVGSAGESWGTAKGLVGSSAWGGGGWRGKKEKSFPFPLSIPHRKKIIVRSPTHSKRAKK